MNNKTLNALLEINANQKRKLAAKNTMLRERAAEIESLEKQLKRETRKLKNQTEMVAYQSAQIDKLKASNKKLRKALKDFKIPILEHQAALMQSSRELKQLQQELNTEKQTSARLNQTIIQRNKAGAPPPEEPPLKTPTTRMVAAVESGQMGTHPIQGGPAGSLGHRSRHARNR